MIPAIIIWVVIVGLAGALALMLIGLCYVVRKSKMKLYYWFALLLTNPVSMLWILYYVPCWYYPSPEIPILLTAVFVWVLSLYSTGMCIEKLGGGDRLKEMLQ